MTDETTTITVHITEGERGFGWRVDCEDCDFTEKMLSEGGASEVAKEHAAEHVLIVWEPLA